MPAFVDISFCPMSFNGIRLPASPAVAPPSTFRRLCVHGTGVVCSRQASIKLTLLRRAWFRVLRRRDCSRKCLPSMFAPAVSNLIVTALCRLVHSACRHEAAHGLPVLNQTFLVNKQHGYREDSKTKNQARQR